MEFIMLSPLSKFTLSRKINLFSFSSFPSTFGGLVLISDFKEDNGPQKVVHAATSHMNTHMAATETLNQNNSQPLTC
jgi:hypothetical protein